MEARSWTMSITRMTPRAIRNRKRIQNHSDTVSVVFISIQDEMSYRQCSSLNNTYSAIPIVHSINGLIIGYMYACQTHRNAAKCDSKRQQSGFLDNGWRDTMQTPHKHVACSLKQNEVENCIFSGNPICQKLSLASSISTSHQDHFRRLRGRPEPPKPIKICGFTKYSHVLKGGSAQLQGLRNFFQALFMVVKDFASAMTLSPHQIHSNLPCHAFHVMLKVCMSLDQSYKSALLGPAVRISTPVSVTLHPS